MGAPLGLIVPRSALRSIIVPMMKGNITCPECSAGPAGSSFRPDEVNRENIAAPFAILWRANLIAAAWRK